MDRAVTPIFLFKIKRKRKILFEVPFDGAVPASEHSPMPEPRHAARGSADIAFKPSHADLG